PGDNLFDIAYSYGFPRWQLEVANPDVEPSALEIGMELVIPSIDVLLPEPIAPGKLIEVNLPEQRLRAYEEGQLRYEFTCSSGMSSTPTIAGQFQVLIKEDVAYAPRWDLDMPYFLGIYLEGPDFYNGIHELPIAGDGRRLWAGVLGWPASYGCIILDIGDAATLYDWAPIGTLVRIKGVAPGTPVYREEVPPPDGEPPPEGVEEPPAGDEAPPAGEETPPTEPPDETSASADGGL
ncbi:MAG: L,D-transpeptidase family protein, partial [Anaerolineales bacterium]|nr:L,D-transpeptidase family protein [Anaerolineales bacterium]